MSCSVKDLERSVLVAHPNQQHSMELATGLKRAKLLHTYMTTVFYRQHSLDGFLMSSLGHGFPGKVKRKQCAYLDDVVKKKDTLFAMMYYALLGRDQKAAYRIYNKLCRKFGVRTAKYAIKHQCQAVVMYDNTAVTCFEYLKQHAPHIKRVLDMSSIPSMDIDEIISLEESRGYGDMFRTKRCRYSKEYCRYFDQEMEDAQFFLSPSSFVDRMIMKHHVQPQQIYRCSYGVNLKDFQYCHKQKNENEVVNFVFTGKIEAAKGVVYLIKAFDRLAEKRNDFKLYLVGANSMDNQEFLSRDYIQNVGYLNKEQLIELYKDMDVFVLPSLWEGKSLSAMEALASGMCLIVSESSGIDEVVRESEAGKVVPAQDETALLSAVEWVLMHKDQISVMSEHARTAVENCSWDDYYKSVQNALLDILTK